LIIAKESDYLRPDMCTFCKGHLHSKETEFIARVGNQIVVIKNVPAWACENCHEAFFTAETSKKIDVILKQFHEGKLLAQPLAAGEISLKTVSIESS
jgi:YgiT-type zinc finger domain-containing protein